MDERSQQVGSRDLCLATATPLRRAFRSRSQRCRSSMSGTTLKLYSRTSSTSDSATNGISSVFDFPFTGSIPPYDSSVSRAVAVRIGTFGPRLAARTQDWPASDSRSRVRPTACDRILYSEIGLIALAGPDSVPTAKTGSGRLLMENYGVTEWNKHTS